MTHLQQVLDALLAKSNKFNLDVRKHDLAYLVQSGKLSDGPIWLVDRAIVSCAIDEKSALYDEARQYIRQQRPRSILAAAFVEGSRTEELRRAVLLHIIEPFFPYSQMSEPERSIFDAIAEQPGSLATINTVMAACGINVWQLLPGTDDLRCYFASARLMEPTVKSAIPHLLAFLASLSSASLGPNHPKEALDSYYTELINAIAAVQNDTALAALAAKATELNSLLTDFILGRRPLKPVWFSERNKDERLQVLSQIGLAKAVIDNLPSLPVELEEELINTTYPTLPILAPKLVAQIADKKRLSRLLLVWASSVDIIYRFSEPYVYGLDEAGKDRLGHFQASVAALPLNAKTELLTLLATGKPPKDHLGSLSVKDKFVVFKLVSDCHELATRELFRSFVVSGQATKEFVQEYIGAYGGKAVKDDIQLWLNNYSGDGNMSDDFVDKFVKAWKLQPGRLLPCRLWQFIKEDYKLGAEDVSDQQRLEQILTLNEQFTDQQLGRSWRNDNWINLWDDEHSRQVLLEHGAACRTLLTSALTHHKYDKNDWAETYLAPAIDKRSDLQRQIFELANESLDKEFETGAYHARRMLSRNNRHTRWLTESEQDVMKSFVRANWRPLVRASDTEPIVPIFFPPEEEVELLFNWAIAAEEGLKKDERIHLPTTERLVAFFKADGKAKKRLREYLLKPERRCHVSIESWLRYALAVFKDDKAFVPIIEELLSSTDKATAASAIRLITEYGY